MYKVLESLYYTAIETETPSAEYWQEIMPLNETVRTQEESLRNTIPHDQFALFEQLLDNTSKREDIRMRYSFIAGFRLAARIMTEALAEES